jgi:arylsulfatase A-like enzyme
MSENNVLEMSNRMNFTKILCANCLVLLSLNVLALNTTSAKAPKTPNVVLILVDDLGRQDMSCEGSDFYETPNIDQIAARGMRFTHAYSACQVCSPSRAAIQTGKYPARLQITDYIGAPQPDTWKRNTKLLPAPYQLQLPLEEVTIAELLQTRGYRTFFAGKWHLGGDGFLPTDQGYSINKGGYSPGTPPGGYFSPYKNPQLEDGPAGELLPLRLGRETAEFIESNKHSASPFFAMLSFYSVHAPIQTTKDLWQKYRDKADRQLSAQGLDATRKRFEFDRTLEVRQVQDNPLYAGMMESMDTAVGMVLDSLRNSGQAENTVVIFTSDNGGVSSGDGYATSCLPFRGGKGRQWEGGIRAPLYIYWPGVTKRSVSTARVQHIDFFPTIAEISGAPSDNFASADGRSLVGVLRGRDLPTRNLYWHYPHYGNQGGEPSAIVVRDQWKLIHYFEDGRNELYNIDADIAEKQDLATSQPERVAAMNSELQTWLRSVNAAEAATNPMYDSAQDEAALKQIREVTMPNREREHAGLLNANFTPRGGWWQDNARGEKK